MKKYKYLKVSSSKKLRYLHFSNKNKLFIIFLHGFMSDIEGKKPETFRKFAKKNNLGFLTLEYSGHGKSSGEFKKGNISKWTSDTKIIIKKIIKKNNFILIGSSMGAWISMNLLNCYKKQIKGFLGIGSAPEFLKYLMWKKFPIEIKKKIKKDKFCMIKSGSYEYPISLQLIKDGEKIGLYQKNLI